MEMIRKDHVFDHLADIFSTAAWSAGTAAEVGGSLIGAAAEERDRIVLESMLHALLTLAERYQIADRLDYAPLIANLQGYDQACTNAVLELLADTGDLQYLHVIAEHAARFPALSEEDYLEALRFQSMHKS